MARIVLILLMLWPVHVAAQAGGRTELQQRLQDNRTGLQNRARERQSQTLRTQRRLDNRMDRLRDQQSRSTMRTSPPVVHRPN